MSLLQSKEERMMLKRLQNVIEEAHQSERGRVGGDTLARRQTSSCFKALWVTALTCMPSVVIFLSHSHSFAQ